MVRSGSRSRIGRSTGPDARYRLGVLSLPALDPADVVERWAHMGLAGRRAVLAAVFERIEVHPATIRGYNPTLSCWRSRLRDVGDGPAALEAVRHGDGEYTR